MFPQTTLDQALLRTAIASRRAELRAMHRTEKKAQARARDARRAVPAPQPAVCCA